MAVRIGCSGLLSPRAEMRDGAGVRGGRCGAHDGGAREAGPRRRALDLGRAGGSAAEETTRARRHGPAAAASSLSSLSAPSLHAPPPSCIARLAAEMEASRSWWPASSSPARAALLLPLPREADRVAAQEVPPAEPLPLRWWAGMMAAGAGAARQRSRAPVVGELARKEEGARTGLVACRPYSRWLWRAGGPLGILPSGLPPPLQATKR
ncbi:unnamed protein product [Urochloa humidicola]